VLGRYYTTALEYPTALKNEDLLVKKATEGSFGHCTGPGITQLSQKQK
jgi:hypothetical protein